MSYGIQLHVWGELACFTRPEMKAERVSYDVITPSAARGILEAIYWKPQIRWVINRIHVLNPIRFTSVRRNEVGSKMPAPSRAVMSGAEAARVGLFVEEERQQRAALLLRDVAYVIEAHFDIIDARFERGGPALPANDCAGKHLDMFRRRASRGQYFHHPYFGTREFPVSFALLEPGRPFPACNLPAEQRNKDLGFMLHDIAFDQDPETKKIRETSPRFFRAELRDGVITVPPFHQARA